MTSLLRLVFLFALTLPLLAPGGQTLARARTTMDAAHRPPTPSDGTAYGDAAKSTARSQPDTPNPATQAVPTQQVSLLRWDNRYDWPHGHGYVGWHHATSHPDAGAYSFMTGLPDAPGLWLWPTGGRTYPPGYAEWTYATPGTTRLLSARIDLAYPPRLLSHHCIAVVVRDATGAERDAERFCSPPQAPQGNPAVISFSLTDPTPDAPTAKQFAIRLEVPCAQTNPKACSKQIPVADPVKNGVQVRRVEMTLVDDDLPVPAPTGEWYDLRDQYVNGRNQHGLTLAASDGGSGITRIAVDEGDVREIAAVNAPCDPTHHTPELDNRLCPATFSAPVTMDATTLSEGKHVFRERAWDMAGHVGVSAPWAVFVDRTAPSMPTNFLVRYFDPVDHEATVSWDAPSDPLLSDGSSGSGMERAEARYRLNDGPFSEWQSAPHDQLDIDGANEGDTITIEARAIDRVGNVSVTGSATLTLQVLLEDPLVAKMAAEWFAGEYHVDLATAYAWMDIQDKTEDLAEEVADSSSGEGYAGVWFDNEARRVKVGLRVGTPHGPVANLLAAQGVANEADIVTTTYTQHELIQAQPAISEALTDLVSQGLISISRRVSTNSIRIEVASTTTANQRARIAQVASAAPVRVTIVDVQVPSLIVEPLSCKFPDCDPPLRGGVRIFSTNRNKDGKLKGCTSGFMVRSRSDRKPYVLTAGHCFDGFDKDFSTWKAFTAGRFLSDSIGPVHNPYVFGDKGDAGLISINNDSLWRGSIRPIVFVTKSTTGSTQRNTAYRIRRVKYNKEGRVICLSGATNGSRCGEVKDLEVEAKYGSVLTGTGVKHLAMLHSCGVKDGDSGGPLFKKNTAYGLVSGTSRDEPCHVYFQGARTAEDLLNVDITWK